MRKISRALLAIGMTAALAMGTVAVFTDLYGNLWDLIGRDNQGAV